MATLHRERKRAQKVIDAAACPTCGAEIGKRCIARRKMLLVHEERRDVWRRRKARSQWPAFFHARVGDKITFEILSATLPEDVGRFSGEIIQRLDENEYMVRRDDGENFAVTQLDAAKFVGGRDRIF